MYTALTFQPAVAGWISKNEYIAVEKPHLGLKWWMNEDISTVAFGPEKGNKVIYIIYGQGYISNVYTKITSK